MEPQASALNGQPMLFGEPGELSKLISREHSLVLLAERIDWTGLEGRFGKSYVPGRGRPGIPTRLMVGLHYLKEAYNESDASVVERFVENPYWQYFCGLKYFTHRMPIDPSSMTRWRRRQGSKGVSELLLETVRLGKELGVVGDKDCKRVVVDTTVQEKAIAFPTDARLLYKARETLVKQAKKRGIKLRQSYKRVGKKLLCTQGRYTHAKQMKRAAGQTRKLRTQLGRVIRDIRRKASDIDASLEEMLGRAERIHRQQRSDKNKLYAMHAPEVECISKGKAHKRYEFGCKASIAISAKRPFILAACAHHGNPYDGHTFAEVRKEVEENTGCNVTHAYLDQGYRLKKNERPTDIEMHLTGKGKRSRSVRRWLRRRASVEPVIGHLKADHRMGRNHLLGKEGDQTQVLLSAAGFNLRALLRALCARLFFLFCFSHMRAEGALSHT